MNDSDLIGLTADIVSAHVSHNNVAATDVPQLIRSVFEALDKVGKPVVVAEPEPEPAVSIRASIKPDYLVCLEDGKKLKMLKRYLRTNYNMSPEEYRAKWGLPKDYPMVAPSYRETRSALAHQIGLGRNKVAAPAAPAAKAPAKKAAAKQAPAAKAAAPAPAKKAAAPAKAAGNGTKKAAKTTAPAADAAPRKRLGIRTAKAAAKAHLNS